MDTNAPGRNGKNQSSRHGRIKGQAMSNVKLFFVSVILLTGLWGGAADAADSRLPSAGQSHLNLQRSAAGYFYGDPTAAEQLILETINRARLNPLEEARLYGIDLNEGLTGAPISSDPVQPLTMNGFLMMSALDHSIDMITNNYLGHDSQDGTSFTRRMINAGFAARYSGENIGWIGSTGSLDEIPAMLHLHQDLFIDDGIDGRAHRLNLLDPTFREVGVGISSGPFTLEEGEASTFYPSSYMLTCDFGVSSEYETAFVLGVVFDDRDQDDFYTAGEGEADIAIEVIRDSELVAETATASAGGYALPLAPGDYLIRASVSKDLYAEKTIRIDDQNIKIDFTLSQIAGSEQPPSAGGGGGGGCFISRLVN